MGCKVSIAISNQLRSDCKTMELKTLASVFFFLAFAFIIGDCACRPQPGPEQQNQVVNGSFYWVVKIAEEACKLGNHDDAQTAKVFECYSKVPGTEIFHTCQAQTFGHLLDTEANLNDFCSRWPETFKYYKCNQKAFADAGRAAELPNAVLNLNLCQASTLKVGQFAKVDI